jgi:enamine deaminase RidA (YjgF/YER057c/UK114 family)
MSSKQVIIPAGSEQQYETWGLAPAIRVGTTVYCSGQIGMAADGSIPEDAEAQLVIAFESLKSVLEAAGATLADIVELTSFHVGLADQLGVFVNVRDRYLKKPYPAQTAVGVAELGLPGLVAELKAVAVVDS